MFRNFAKRMLRLAAVSSFALLAFQGVAANAQSSSSITIESWRTDDVSMWNNTIIPAFNKAHPEITVKFVATKPDQYDGALNAKLKSGTAGDIITCRPFTRSLNQFQAKQLDDLTSLPGLENFGTFAKHAWSTPDDKTTFCVPMASVLHGFIYNKDYFDANGFTVPKTYEDFLTLLDKIKAEGSMIPLAVGVKDGWASQTMGFDNIGPNFWGGEAGVDGILNGTRKYNDPGFLAAFDALSKWVPYLGPNVAGEAYTDSQTLFTSGQAAIFPAGSWEIAGFEAAAKFKMGAFPAPPPASAKQCYVENQIDIAMGLNSASTNKDAAKTFLSWAAGQDFETMYAQGLPGFFPLGNYKFSFADPLANTFLSWTSQCGSTLRNTDQIPAAPNTNLDPETSMWNTNSQLLLGKLTAQQAADLTQKNLDSWYHPAGAASAATMAATAASK